jgi:hypothetical protein
MLPGLDLGCGEFGQIFVLLRLKEVSYCVLLEAVYKFRGMLVSASVVAEESIVDIFPLIVIPGASGHEVQLRTQI